MFIAKYLEKIQSTSEKLIRKLKFKVITGGILKRADQNIVPESPFMIPNV